MLLLLKIPLFYLCGVVWYAVKAEPVTDDAPGDFAPVREPRTPGSGGGGRRRMARRVPQHISARRSARRPERSRAALARLGARR